MSIFDNSSTQPVVLSFNSKDRVGGENSNFISKGIDLGVNRYDSVCLVQASIPRSFYNVATNFNTFTLREPAPLLRTITITMPVGSYNKINFASVLATTLTAASLASGNSFTYAVSYPSALAGDTFKYTFSVSGNGVNQPQFILTTNMNRQLGFEEDTTYSFVANSLVSANCINLSYITRAFIKSNVCQNAQDGILEEILNYGSFPMLSLCYYQQLSFDLNTRSYNTSASNSWNFALVDSFDRLIDLNGIPWSFSLVFYKRNDTHQIHKNELMITNEERLFKVLQEQEKVKEEITKTTEKLPEIPLPLQSLPVINPPLFSSTNTNMSQPVFELQPIGLSETLFQEPTPITQTTNL